MPKDIEFDLTPFQEFQRRVVAELSGTGSGPLADAIQRRWADRYFDFIRRRYRQNSAGGGEWAPLSPMTLAKDKYNKRTGNRKGILRKSDTMYDALIPGGHGNLIVKVKGGVKLGVSDAGHPFSNLRIADLFKIHHKGTSKMPARPIFVEPDSRTIEGFKRDFALGARDLENGLPQPRRFTKGISR